MFVGCREVAAIGAGLVNRSDSISVHEAGLAWMDPGWDGMGWDGTGWHYRGRDGKVRSVYSGVCVSCAVRAGPFTSAVFVVIALALLLRVAAFVFASDTPRYAHAW